MRKLNQTRRRGAFTTIELLVVIGIIVLLIGILIPVVGRIRESATATNTAAWIQQLSGAIEAYHSDFRAYPGPLPNDAIRAANPGDINLGFATPWPSDYVAAQGAAVDGVQRVTMTENLVLGLLGGLRLQGTNVVYDPVLVGGGPMSLNPGQPRRYSPYVESIHLSWREVGNQRTGAFMDDASQPNGADDSIIPEFVDRYTDPMPILYLRAKVGSRVPPDASARNNNAVVTEGGVGPSGFRSGQYDVTQIIGYTDTNIGVGRKLPGYVEDGAPQQAPNYVHGLRTVNPARTLTGAGQWYPYDAFPYFRDPALSNQTISGGSGYAAPHVARQKDRFILISAGPDRIYGTNDDITNFGAVVP